MKKKSKKRILSLSLVLAFMVGMMVNFPINANAATGSYYDSTILIGSSYKQPVNVILDNSGNNIYVSEYYMTTGGIKKMDKEGKNSTTITSSLNEPIGMVFDSNGDLYVAEYYSAKVLKIDHDNGVVSDVTTVVASTGPIVQLTGIVLDSSKQHLYVADYNNGKIVKMNKDGSNKSDFAIGFGRSSIIGMTIDSSDNLYVSDLANNSVRKIDTSATVTTFATGLSSCRWVTKDSYGYFYASDFGNKLIKKLDANGNVIDSFSTGNYNPWGATVDSSGYIYFTDLNKNLVKIVGKGNTVGANQIVLEMNNELVGSETDPSAFTLHGIASNPTITSAEVSGKNVTLTLSSPISITDTSIKVDYTKSGSNNLTGNMTIGSSTQVQLDNFSGLPVKNNVASVVSVVSVTPISNKNVAYGTTRAELSLPTNVNVGLSNSTTASAVIIWDNGSPAYDGNTPGSYAFSGKLTCPSSNSSNPGNLKASVNVIVGADPAPPIPPVTTPASVKIVGTERVGEILSAEIFDGNRNKVTTSAGVTIQWYRLSDPASNSGELVGSNKTYTLVNDDINKYIKVHAMYNGEALDAITSIITSQSSSSRKSSKPKAITGNGVSAVATGNEALLGLMLKDVNGYKVELTNRWGDETLGGTVSNMSDQNGDYVGSIITAAASGLAKLPIEYSSSKDLKYIYKYEPTTKLFIKMQGTVSTDDKNIEIPVNKDETYYVTKAEMPINTVLNEGWNTINNVTYRVEGASLKSGWIFENNIWNYVDEASKVRVENNWDLINNNWYFFNEKGNMVTGWKELGGQWYYLDNNGSMATGWQYVNSNWYYLNANGAMAKDTVIDSYNVDENGALI